MATAQRRPPETQPAGVDGEGLEAYPTYRDGPDLPHEATGTKPTDVELPRSGRTSGVPMFIGLIAFAAVVIGLILWASFRTSDMSDAGLAPPASTPAVEAPATSNEGEIRDIRPDAQTGPGEVQQTPGPADVPGGDATTPVEPETSQ